MAFDHPGPDISVRLATTGIPQYSWVQLNSSGKWASSTASGTTAGRGVVGVVQSSGTTGSTNETVQTIRLFGVTKSRVSTASTGISAGDLVTVSTNSAAITPTTAGDNVLGVSFDDVASTSDIVSVLIYPLGTT